MLATLQPMAFGLLGVLLFLVVGALFITSIDHQFKKAREMENEGTENKEKTPQG